MLEIGSVIDGKYKVLNEIGRGGMSTVYLAVNEKANKPWAIKSVRKDSVEQLEVLKQGLVAEIRILKQLQHPGLPSIIDIIDTEEELLIVMDYVEGRNLQDLLEEEGPVVQDQAVSFGIQLCEVLAYLHSQDIPIIYRDLKPSNIMVRPDGRIVLIDFGTAREYKKEERVDTDTICLGTRGYAAPEQYGGQGQTDARTDIYSLGATLYHLLTGHNPSKPPYEVLPIRQWNSQLAIGLEKIILRCTRTNPEDRYQNCEEILYDLEHYETLDDQYRRRQVDKLRIFLFSLVITLLSGVLSCYGFAKESYSRGQNYGHYLEQALAAPGIDSKEAYLEKAMELDPRESQAYLSYLENDLTDDCFSREELRRFLEMLDTIVPSSGKTYLECLEQNEEGYTEVCYQLGIACFFMLEEASGKASSKVWFDHALSSETYLTGPKRERAKVYSRIATYYSNLGREDVSGELQGDHFEELFADLKELNKNEVSDFGGNVVTACQLYDEIGRLMGEHAYHFLCTGKISPEDLEKEMFCLKSHVDDLQTLPQEADTRNLEKRLEEAEFSILAAEQLSHRTGEALPDRER